MDLEIRRYDEPKCGFSSYSNLVSDSIEERSIVDLETDLIKSVVRDDKEEFVNLTKRLFADLLADHHRTTVSKLLHFCCSFDSASCATSLVNGELGTVAVVNEVDHDTGMSALHVAAEAHAARCVELLLKRRARTEVRSKDGRGLLALELSLSCSRMDVVWNPDDYSSEDLVVMLGEKNLTTVRLLSEKTKEINEVAYVNAMEGRVVALASLLIVASEKVKESVMVSHDAELGLKERATIYECVIREALSLSRATTPSRTVKRNCTMSESESAKKRKLLLCEIELLQLLGAAVAAHSGCTEKKVTSPLILATQAGDEAVIELLLKSNIDVNDVDAEGNSALHCSLKTNMKSGEQQIKIITLLLKHGARVSHKNKLGLTAVHIAAASGNSRALEVLLLEDPDCIDSKTIMDETPLFYAVKNDHMDCVELLLRWGVRSEVLNLRERPIDLAKSQDMRFLLSPAQISHLNRAFPICQKSIASQEGVELHSETVQTLLSMADEGTNTNPRMCSSTKTMLCKYFKSPSGCIRGTKCFYAHGEEELQKTKKGIRLICSPSIEDLKRKIFVGGLPLSVDSDLLREFFEEHFGSVEDAKVVRVQSEKQIQSGEFGFITFQHEKSVLAAIKAHNVTIMGKQAEIKSAIPKYFLLAEIQKHTSPKQVEQRDQSQPQTQMISEKIKEEKASRNSMKEVLTGKTSEVMKCNRSTEDTTPDQRSWADRLLPVQPKTEPDESQNYISTMNMAQKIPKWLSTFIKWFPRFLKDTYDHLTEGEYALSSLKNDFKAAFGLELDHASLGYSKLSEFMRAFPDLCYVKAGTLNKFGSPNHMVLLPSLNNPKWRVLQRNPLLSPVHAINNFSNGDANNCDVLEDIQSVSEKYTGFFNRGNGEKLERKATQCSSTKEDTYVVPPNFLEFFMPDTVFQVHSILDYENDGGAGEPEDGRAADAPDEINPEDRLRHLVLEALARKRNNTSVFFLREYGFYDEYNKSFDEKLCFWCHKEKMLWMNSPCNHLLWCGDCKEEAVKAAGNSEHKCVICDAKVKPIILLSNNEEFPPLRNSPSKKKRR